MVIITFIKASKEKDPSQRRTLFKTTCKCMGKVCKVVIDSGSAYNMVSNEMVEKLRLSRIPHDTLYKLYWLNEGQ